MVAEASSISGAPIKDVVGPFIMKDGAARVE